MRKRVEQLIQGKKKIHFIGIGGSGMFPLVEILHSEGHMISGSDVNEGSIIDREREMGIRVSIGHAAENVDDAEVVVVTAALLDGNPEVARAQELNLPILERAELLGYITSRYAKSICISGTHGKTTTTSMLTSILFLADADPTVVIGGKLPLIGGYGRAGHSDLMVCEACEFKDTFLETMPYYSVLLNVDADHLDYFKTVERLMASFRRFAQSATKAVIANGDDSRTMETIRGIDTPVYTFGQNDGCDFVIREIENYDRAYYRFALYHKQSSVGTFTLRVPGRHNVYNAAAAVVCAYLEGVSSATIQAGFDSFYGAGRRFEVLGVYDGITIADDYAHHPAELEVTLDAAQNMGYNRVVAVFQPFTFSRTVMLLEDFAKALSVADVVVLTEIMGSREINTYDITSEALARQIPGAVWFKTFEEVCDHCLSIAQKGDLILTLGCGDVYKVANMMVKKCQH
jgi:UDP-N-acetylmuramate--alanine ligase